MASQDTAVVLSSDDEEEGAGGSEAGLGARRTRFEGASSIIQPFVSASSSKRERDIHQQMHILHHELQWPHR